MASINRNVAAVHSANDDAAEDLIASSPSLWPPRTVVKRHRKKATVIWVSLLAAFLVYVGYIVWDTVDTRRTPAASVELKQSPFKFPDVAVCAGYGAGCLESTNCLADGVFTLLSQQGFMEDTEDFDLADYPDVAKVTTAFPHCAVMPLSQLTVNETGVENGDIDSFGATLWLLWLDHPDGDFNPTDDRYFNPTDLNSFTQYVSAHFIDIEQDVDQIGENVVDVGLPYERIKATRGEWFPAMRNHMVISLSEFSGITKNGERKETEKTYTQTTTSSKNWYWAEDSYMVPYAFLEIEMIINKFEYTRVLEVDPVDIWAIIGAIGGVWQFVVVAFGVFFVFSEKQPPDKKMRSFYDTVIMPTVTINKRLSSITTASSRSSQQDIEIDAAGEDLPPGWVKKQRKNRSVYYFHTMTASISVSPPNERDEIPSCTSAAAAPRTRNGIRTLFRVANGPEGSGAGGLQGSTNGTGDGESLPPGWLERTAADGKVYYVDEIHKTTQWNRPALRIPSTNGDGVRAVDAPMRRVRRGSSNNLSLGPAPPAIVPSTTSPATGGGVDNPLPPNWETRTDPDGKTYYSNRVTKKTQWESPRNPV